MTMYNIKVTADWFVVIHAPFDFGSGYRNQIFQRLIRTAPCFRSHYHEKFVGHAEVRSQDSLFNSGQSVRALHERDPPCEDRAYL